MLYLSRSSFGKSVRHSFTLIELLVVIAIIAIFQAGTRFPEAFRMLAELLHPGVDFGTCSETRP